MLWCSLLGLKVNVYFDFVCLKYRLTNECKTKIEKAHKCFHLDINITKRDETRWENHKQNNDRLQRKKKWTREGGNNVVDKGMNDLSVRVFNKDCRAKSFLHSIALKMQ